MGEFIRGREGGCEPVYMLYVQQESFMRAHTKGEFCIISSWGFGETLKSFLIKLRLLVDFCALLGIFVFIARFFSYEVGVFKCIYLL